MTFYARNEMNEGNGGCRVTTERELLEIEFTNKVLSDPVLSEKCEKMSDKQWFLFLEENIGSLRCPK